LEYVKSQYFVSQFRIILMQDFYAAAQKWRKPPPILADSAVSKPMFVHVFGTK